MDQWDYTIFFLLFIYEKEKKGRKKKHKQNINNKRSKIIYVVYLFVPHSMQNFAFETGKGVPHSTQKPVDALGKFVESSESCPKVAGTFSFGSLPFWWLIGALLEVDVRIECSCGLLKFGLFERVFGFGLKGGEWGGWGSNTCECKWEFSCECGCNLWLVFVSWSTVSMSCEVESKEFRSFWSGSLEGAFTWSEESDGNFTGLPCWMFVRVWCASWLWSGSSFFFFFSIKIRITTKKTCEKNV